MKRYSSSEAKLVRFPAERLDIVAFEGMLEAHGAVDVIE